MRTNFPKSEITLVCGSWNRAQAEASGYFDKVLAFDFFPEDNSARLATPARDVLRKEFEVLVVDESYDLAADFRLYDDTRFLLQVVNARHKAGFDRTDAFPWMPIRLKIPSPTADQTNGTRVSFGRTPSIRALGATGHSRSGTSPRRDLTIVSR